MRPGNGLMFNERFARTSAGSPVEKLYPKINTKTDICSSTGI
jgi:hypothetical protein